MRVERDVPPTLSRRRVLGVLATFGAGLGGQHARAESGLAGAAQAALATLGRWADAHKASFGGIVLDARTGETLGAVAAQRPLNPASNQKILTAIGALETLGPEHRFTTSLGLEAGAGPNRAIVLRSDGDPELSVADLSGLIADLRQREPGLRVGDVVVDQSAFDSQWDPPLYASRPDDWAAYRAPVSAVAVERNAVTLHVLADSAGRSARFWFDPPGLVQSSGSIQTSARGAREGVRLTMRPAGDRLDGLVGGSVPEGSRELFWSRRLIAPERAAGYVLRELLVRQGVRVSGAVRAGRGLALGSVASWRSRPLAQLLHALGKNSDNFAAEMLLKATGARRDNGPGTSAGGLRVLEGHLRRIGELQPGTRLQNGSGLYDANRVSAWTIGRVLSAALRDARVGPELLSSLAIGGVDGTLRERFKSTRSERSVRAKTGTLAGVLALSGYVLRASGPLAFSLLLNDVRTAQGEARARLDEAVSTLARP